MKKFWTISLILFLIFFTAMIKNSTKNLEDEIFISRENIRSLNKELENVKLEYDFLSSAEKLLDFQNSYFDEELIKKEIADVKMIKKKFNELNLNNNDEK